MPELPEVEVIRQGLIPHVVGKKIIAVRSGSKNLRLPIPRNELQKFARGGTVTAIGRRAKYLVFFLDKAAMIIHLGMSGKLGIFAPDSPPAVHDHLVFQLEDAMEIRFNDARRFGFIKLCTPLAIQQQDPFIKLGPEPLALPHLKGITAAPLIHWYSTFTESHYQLTPSYLKKKAGTRLQPIKNFLMDSHVVAGIGNIYANEILFTTSILPTTPIGSITQSGWKRIHSAINSVLSKAVQCGGTTIRDFISSSGQPGYFQLELKAYGRDGEPCVTCQRPIVKSIIAGRATYFCPYCQH